MPSLIENINAIREKLDAIVAANDLFDAETVQILEAFSELDVSLIIEDFAKGNYLGNRKIDIDLALNNLSETELVTYKQADITLVNGTKLEMPFDNGSGGILELSSHADIKEYISTHALYVQVVDTEIVVSEAFGNTPAMIRVRDADGKASNIERIELHVYTGTVADTKPVYFWAKTTSSLETLANRAGDIIQLGNDIDSIVTLSQRIDELIALQAEIAKILDVHTNLADVVTTAQNIGSVNTTATNIAGINAVALKIVELNAIYADLADILDASNQATIATEQAAIATSKAAEASGSATTATEQAAIATSKANEIKSVSAQAQTLAAGSAASASYNPVDGKLTFGIPQGAKGDKGDSFTVNAVGLIAQRTLYDLQAAGFSFLAIDEALIYFKLSATSGDWSIGSPFGKGDTGDTGATGNGIANVSFVGTTDASGQPAQSGAIDTYRITFTDATTSDFTIHNGLDSDVFMVDLTTHTNRTDNPHAVTKAQVGLGSVDNTSDANKPVSTAQQAALDLKADIDYVNEVSGLDPNAYLLGQAGEIGFGVATATADNYMSVGMIPLVGHNVIGSDNYGNYMHAASGGIFCFVPKHYFKIDGNVFSYSDVAATGYVLDRSFINGGVEINGVFISKYGLTKNGTMASSQAGKDPMSTAADHNPISALAGTPTNTYGGLYAAVKSMDVKAFLTPIFHYSMLARMAKAHGQASISTSVCAFIDVDPKHPKGNLNNALSDVNDTSVTFSASGYSNCALTGSGRPFAKTTHNGQNCGIADLNGNMWEVASGFIRYDANGFLLLKESVDIRTILNDSITAGSGGAYDVNLYDVLDLSDHAMTTTTVSVYLGNAANQVFAFDTNRTTNNYKRTAAGIALATGVSVAGTTEFGNDYLVKYLRNEMACIVGGSWGYTSSAGAFALYLGSYRTNSSYTVGGRASFLV